MVQHIEMPFAPYDRATLDASSLSLSAVAALLVLSQSHLYLFTNSCSFFFFLHCCCCCCCYLLLPLVFDRSLLEIKTTCCRRCLYAEPPQRRPVPSAEYDRRRMLAGLPSHRHSSVRRRAAATGQLHAIAP